jgi:hypothetical protein
MRRSILLTSGSVLGAAGLVLSGIGSSPSIAAPTTTTTDQVGNVAATGTTESSTSCPTGSSATGIVVHTLSSTSYVRGVELVCSNGTTSSYAGGSATFGENVATTSCAPGDRAVAVAGRGGAVVDALGAICLSNTDQTSRSPELGSSGGSEIGPAQCPRGAVLVGMNTWWGDYQSQDTVKSFQGICDVLAVSVPPTPTPPPTPIPPTQCSLGAPVIRHAWAGHRGAPTTATVSWSAARSTCSEHRTGYRVTAQKLKHGRVVRTRTFHASASAHRRRMRLPEHRRWRFAVAAVDSRGGGPRSVFSNTVRPR